ncbi:hypothetical protein HF521_011339 [Silurus meridionalis]|uniref:Nucleoside diphosphate kinase-like domain-containing protein n=1 Tax=Silurus meridionalis TaxID=175797 RepID=A0A8T0AHK2_SILME|nr:hypothetical protein HF521_011339 [Silurus meridionalis]
MSLAKPSSCSAEEIVTNIAPFWNRKRGWTAFSQQVLQSLAQTQLGTVASWLPGLNHLLEKKAFGTNPDFYWQTLSIQEQICEWAEVTTSQQPQTEVALALVHQAMFHNTLATHHTLQLLFSSGLDVCGLCPTYLSKELLASCVELGMSELRRLSEEPLLAMAIHGPNARAVWQNITGSSDPMLARKTDPASINALHCHCQEHTLFYSPNLASLVHFGLSVWFGGRLPSNDHRMTAQAQSYGNRGNTEMLCATAKADVFLLVSPVVPPCCYSHVLASCAKHGFQLMGLQRIQISDTRASSLGLSAEQMLTFCYVPMVSMDEALLESFSHCLVLLLRRENALRHSANLPTGLMNKLSLQRLVGLLQTRLPHSVHLKSDLCFYAVPYTQDLFNFLGDHTWTVPDFSPVVLAKHTYPSCREIEQIVILTLTGHNIMEKDMSRLHKVLYGKQAGEVSEDRFELLALKWLPTLSWRLAQELSPFEVSEHQWHSRVVSLISFPALVFMFKYLPLPSIGSSGQSLFSSMTEGAQVLHTLALFKPGVWIQQNGFTLVGFRMLVLNLKMANTLRNASAVINGKHLLESSDRDSESEYLTSGPVLALCLQRVNAVKKLLELLGPEDLAQARTEDLHFWRASYGTDRLLKAFTDRFLTSRLFSEGLCCTETLVMKHEQVPCLRADPVASLERQQSHTIANNKQMGKSELFGGCSVCSALCQTTCLIMPSCVLQLSRPPLHLDLLQQLLSTGCHVVAVRLCSLDQTQITHPALFLKPTTGCIYLTISQVDHRICRDMPDLEKVKNMLFYPGTEPEEVKLLCYLFEVLSPDSHHSIVP